MSCLNAVTYPSFLACQNKHLRASNYRLRICDWQSIQPSNYMNYISVTKCFSPLTLNSVYNLYVKGFRSVLVQKHNYPHGPIKAVKRYENVHNNTH